MARLALMLAAAVGGAAGLVLLPPLEVRAKARSACTPIVTRACTPATPRARPPLASEAGALTPPLETLASRLWAWGWLNWWVQGSLSVVSAVLLLFANSVTMPAVGPPVLLGRALALGACGASFTSTFWSWGYTRLARRMRRKPEKWTRESAVSSARQALFVGTAINLVGIGLAILGAEAIVGTLAAKALTQGSAVVLDSRAAATTIQALDVLIVQANTNTLAACYMGLLGAMRLKLSARATAEDKQA
eukprot:scaffold213602_cov32-Tisochrysis_lutea.AAC.1